MSGRQQLNEDQADVLREFGNIGAGHAATALSVLLRDEVRMSVTSAKIVEFDEIANVVGGAEAIVVGVFLRMNGDLSGNMFLLLSLHSAKKLLSRLLECDQEVDDFTEIEVSALGEVGNILGGSYLNAISTLCSLYMNQTVPAVAIDMAGAILDIGILMAGETSDSAILINTSIWQGESNIDGHFFLLPDPASTDLLLQALGC
jgi:chemotaxis protein CheC